VKEMMLLPMGLLICALALPAAAPQRHTVEGQHGSEVSAMLQGKAVHHWS